MRTKSSKPKRGFLDGYKTYDPHAEGYGNEDSWATEFRWRMSLDEAKERVGKNSPLFMIFGDTMPLGWLAMTVQSQFDAIKKAWKKVARSCHPDLNPNDPGAEERFKNLMAAYDVLCDQYKRKGATV